MNEQNKDKILEKAKEVFSDVEFTKSLFAMESAEEVQKALSGRGLDLSTEEILQIRDVLSKAEAEGKGELSEDDLESVSGGIILSGCLAGLILTGVGVVIAGGATAGAASLISGARW